MPPCGVGGISQRDNTTGPLSHPQRNDAADVGQSVRCLSVRRDDLRLRPLCM